jgi:hypothetical protein
VLGFRFLPSGVKRTNRQPIPLEHLATAQRHDAGQGPVHGAHARQFREDAFPRTIRPVRTFVRRLMSEAYQAAVLVERAIGQVRAHVPASARHRENSPLLLLTA